VKINVISLLKCNTPFNEAIHKRRTGKYNITRRDWGGALLALFGSGFIYRGLSGHSYVEEAPGGYEIFKHKEDECIKVVLKP
jgi:threonine dehydrogenase-like Zn-dependent dehydrogenase